MLPALGLRFLLVSGLLLVGGPIVLLGLVIVECLIVNSHVHGDIIITLTLNMRI